MICKMEQPKTHQEDELDLKAVSVAKKKLCYICNNLHDSMTMNTNMGD